MATPLLLVIFWFQNPIKETPFEPIVVDDDNDPIFGALISNENTSKIPGFFTNKFIFKIPNFDRCQNATLSFWTSWFWHVHCDWSGF